MKNKKRFDIIGDIHGHADKLTALLERLNYRPHGNHYRHPEGRKVIFLGDYIDRGPKIRETLELVRNMVDAGAALAIMGNHELNAILYDTPDGNGSHLKEHSDRNRKTHAATLAAFTDREDEWAGWIEWMKHLPMFLDLGELRAVHAAWDDKSIAFLRGKSLADDDFLRVAATFGAMEFEAVEIVLKGPELPTPDGKPFFDRNGTERWLVRARWWGLHDEITVGELAMPPGAYNIADKADAVALRKLPNYPADAPPVFFGHYWMPPTAPKEPLSGNIVVLDFSAAAKANPLYAYRWNGEANPTPENFITYEIAA